MNCKEFDFSKTQSIEAFPCLLFSDKIPPVVLPVDDIVLDVSEGEQTHAIALPFVSGSVQVDHKQDVSVAGRVHTVTLSWEMNQNVDTIERIIHKLRSGGYQFLVRSFGGSRHLLRTTQDGFLFSYTVAEGKYKCTATLINGQGLTLLK